MSKNLKLSFLNNLRIEKSFLPLDYKSARMAKSSSDLIFSLKKKSRKKRCAGILVPLFTLRKVDDFGIGDIGALRDLVDVASKVGFSVLQLLPINELSMDNSPYNAMSSVAIEPLTLELNEQLLEDLNKDEIKDELKAFNIGPNFFSKKRRVDYELSRRIKFALLGRAYRNFCANDKKLNNGRYKNFLSFRKKEKDWLDDYCIFRYLFDLEGKNIVWPSWSSKYNNIEKARLYIMEQKLSPVSSQKIEYNLGFFAYIQWLADEQWRGIRDYSLSKGVSLMGDVPFGVNYYSVDVFSEEDKFDSSWFGGAPPEKNFTSDKFTERWGQNWGIPLYNWKEMEKDNYGWWRQRIRSVTRYFDIFRIDHILGFYRIYSFPWHPRENSKFVNISRERALEETGGKLPRFINRPDDSPENVKANRRDGEKLLRVVMQEAKKCVVVGEDLGLVPDYMGESLDKLGIYNMIVPHWKWEEGRVRRAESYNKNSMTLYTTHDHNPLHMQWNDSVFRYNENGTQESNEGLHFLRSLIDYAEIGVDKVKIPKFNDEIKMSLFSKVLSSESDMCVIGINDVLSIDDVYNTPGTSSNKNWTIRMKYNSRDLLSNSKTLHDLTNFSILINAFNR